jgi:hypothetical protein
MLLRKITSVDGVQLALSYVIKFILIGTAVLAAVGADWEVMLLALVAVILTFVPALFERNYKINLPTEFELVIVTFIFAGLFLGEIQNFYVHFWWWDLFLHTSSGIILGFLGFLILYILYYQKKLNASPALISLFAFCFALAIGALWEIFEFSMDTIFGFSMQKGLFDTMWDLIVTAIGALVASVVGYFYIRNQSANSFGKLINKFISKNPELTRK